MAAADYKICCALFDAYIAKVSKKNPEMMLQDRRSISQGEILTLIDWFANIDILSPLKEVKFLDTNVAATPS